jgi:hypothetical protein
MFMMIWHSLNGMVDYASGFCSLNGQMMNEFCFGWFSHNYVGIFVLIYINHHLQLFYHVILTNIICNLIGSHDVKIGRRYQGYLTSWPK